MKLLCPLPLHQDNQSLESLAPPGLLYHIHCDHAVSVLQLRNCCVFAWPASREVLPKWSSSMGKQSIVSGQCTRSQECL
eukprot:scaffold75351_cov31-Tisochrysis_lutea.AAC.1